MHELAKSYQNYAENCKKGRRVWQQTPNGWASRPPKNSDIRRAEQLAASYSQN